MSTLWAGLRKNIQSSFHMPCTCVTFSRRALNIEHITHTHTLGDMFSLPIQQDVSVRMRRNTFLVHTMSAHK